VTITEDRPAKRTRTSLSSRFSQQSARYCEGYALEREVFCNFPFHIMYLEKEKCEFVFAVDKFHSIACSKKNFLITDENSQSIGCANLPFNSFFKSLMERSEVNDTSY
jgi:hypothetical protein